MKKILISISITLFFLCISCEEKIQSSSEFALINVDKNYSFKELVLQDFMDVEYVPLESTDEFICQGFVQDVTENYIIVRNFLRTGDIFIFDRKGKAVKKINRIGQGGEEYVLLLEALYDEETDDLFVSDLGRKIMIYDKEGNYKRYFKARENGKYKSIRNFDRNYLICYDGNVSNDGETNGQNFLLVSKQDGSSKTIHIPFEKSIITAVISKTFQPGVTWGITPQTDFPLVPYKGKWILMEPSCDTLYTLSPDLVKKPFIVREPSIQNMTPEVFLFLSIITDRYYFMETVKREYDFADKKGYPSTNLVYDKEENKIYRSIVYNEDYTIKEDVQMNYIPLNQDIASCHIIPAHELVVAYQKGWLKEGRLKEISATLDDESNPVLMFYKHKKEE